MIHAGAARRGRRGAHPRARLPAVDGDDEPRRRHARALPLRRGERLAARPRGHPRQDHAAHEGDRRHQPEQPHRRRLLARGAARASSQIAREHSLLLLADEIYDRILFDGAAAHPAGDRSRPTCSCLTFNGLSKTYRVAGYRSGWLVITGPKDHAAGLPRGHHAAGLHPPVSQRPGAARGAGGAVGCAVDRRSHRPGGRLHEQRDVAWKGLEAIPGRLLRAAARGALRLPAARPRGLRDPRRRAVRLRLPRGRARAAGPGHGLQLARRPTTCASSRCPRPACSATPSSGSATSCRPTARVVPQRCDGPRAAGRGPEHHRRGTLMRNQCRSGALLTHGRRLTLRVCGVARGGCRSVSGSSARRDCHRWRGRDHRGHRCATGSGPCSCSDGEGGQGPHLGEVGGGCALTTGRSTAGGGTALARQEVRQTRWESTGQFDDTVHVQVAAQGRLSTPRSSAWSLHETEPSSPPRESREPDRRRPTGIP